MLVLDSESQQIWQQQKQRETSADARLKALAHEIESNTISVSNDDRYDVSNILNQLGYMMTAEQVQQRLKKCNSRLHFIRSPQFPELTGVYLITNEWEATPAGDFKKKLKHICGMESGPQPEFSVLHKTKKKVPNKELFGKKSVDREVPWVEVETFSGETRGWRTVLVRLLHARLITMGQVNEHFPPPSRNSEKWYRQTH
jgi:hypothetical protein